MIGDERPSKAKSFRLSDNITQPFNKIIPVLIIGKYTSALDSANNDMMQGTGSIDAGFAIFFISQETRI